eukprot:15291857-Ditylum_brightwellii.AAC.1
MSPQAPHHLEGITAITEQHCQVYNNKMEQVIVEGDMNGILKVIWNKRLVLHAEEQNMLSE